MIRYGISSLLVLGALLISIFYLKPAWDQFRQIRTETEHVRALSAEFDDLIQNRDTLIAKLNLVSKADLQKLEALIPQGARSLDYLIALQRAGQESGIELIFTRADINPPTQTAPPQRASSPRATAGAVPEISGTPGAVVQPGAQPQMLNPSEQPQPQTAIKELPVGIDIAGSYEALKGFIGRLEHFGRLTDISTVSFSSQSGSDQGPSNVFRFSLGLMTHYQ